MKMLGLMAVRALVVGVIMTSWARSAGPAAEMIPPTQSWGATQSAPAQPSHSQPTAPKAPKINPDLPGSAGLNVHYLDSDGEVKNLDVKDFPR